MKNIISLLISCSLVLAGAALAQRPVEQESPSKGKRAPEKARAPEAKPRPDAAKPQERPAKQPGAMKEPGAAKERGAPPEPGAGKARKAPESREPATAPAKERDVSREAEGAPKPGAKQQAEQRKKEQAEQRKKEMKEPAAAPKTHTSPAAAAAGAAPPAGQQVKGAGAKAKKPDPQKVQQIKTQHANFRAQPKPQQVQAVTFNQNRRIERSETWHGQQYEVFRSYRPEWHDAGWYHSRYPNVTLIAGGYYFFNNGYWFPAWGYNPSAQYYAYDGPIYVGQRAQPPDQVIADVQAVLQEMGYYRGEVDGLLGPLTREALTAYQADNGLTTTAAIDQPTLDSLGMG